MRYFFILPLVLVLSACSLTPPLVKPELPVPSQFPDNVQRTQGLAYGADLDWRTMFADPRLQRLIRLALDNNRDLRVAVLNVQAVQAQFRIQRAAQLPGIDLNGAMSRGRMAADAMADGDTASVHEQHSVALGLSAFEIDLFGRLQAQSDAAFARYLATDQGHRAAEIALVGAVADAYFAERLAQGQLQLAQQTLTDWQQSLDLARRLKQADQNSGLDVAQAEGQVATAEAGLQSRQRTLAQARNALDLLVGAELPAGLPEPMALDDRPVVMRLPAGLPSDLLLRRPDILQAEQNLLAANADIGAARAAFFPRLSLTASLGFASPAMSGLFDSGHRVWEFSPQISQPLFQGGRLRAELRLAELRKSVAVAEYEHAIQAAFREVADGLAGQATYGGQIDAQARVVASAERRVALSGQRYRAGLDGRLELLDSQRQLYAARQTLMDLYSQQLSNTVALYKALGGGLVSEAADTLAGTADVDGKVAR